MASRWLSAVLEVALEGTASRRPQACRKRDTRTDLSYGCRESDVGSTPHPRRTDEAWLQSLRADSLAMAPASSQKPRSVQALADIPAESPRGHRGDGFLHRADAHVWYLVLLLRDRSRPAENSAFNVTRNPGSLWIVQQMRDAWPYVPAQKFLLCDHDSKFSRDVLAAARTLGSEPIRTAFRSPWQNGVAERWVGSCRRDLLDHVIVLNERHLKRLMGDYIRYYHEDRTHLGLAKDTPQGRSVATASANGSRIRSFSRLGGLHHRYSQAA